MLFPSSGGWWHVKGCSGLESPTFDTNVPLLAVACTAPSSFFPVDRSSFHIEHAPTLLICAQCSAVIEHRSQVAGISNNTPCTDLHLPCTTHQYLPSTGNTCQCWWPLQGWGMHNKIDHIDQELCREVFKSGMIMSMPIIIGGGGGGGGGISLRPCSQQREAREDKPVIISGPLSQWSLKE